MTDQDDKHKMLRRHLKQADKQQARDEREQIKKKRIAHHGRDTDRQRHVPDADDWDDEPRVRSVGVRGRSAVPAPVTWTGLVIGIRPDRLDVRRDGRDCEVMLRRGHPLPFPAAVGDEVVCIGDTGAEVAVDLTARRSRLSRPDPHDRGRERVIAANVDLAVVVLAAKDPEFKPALIDRYLVSLEAGGVGPVVCVNKFDLADTATRDLIERELEVYRALGITCILTSAVTGMGVSELRSALTGRTVVFSGHSGVGKSALLNRLDPDVARDTGSGRGHDGKGRHTTTRSELRVLASGTRVIDTPGIREFGLWAVDTQQLRVGFPGIGVLAAQCRFGDCRHIAEPQCAVREGFPAARYQAYRKLLAEAEG